MKDTHPINPQVSYIEEEFGVSVETSRLQNIIDYALADNRVAVSDTESGLYAVYSSRGFSPSEASFPVVKCVIIFSQGAVLLIPKDFDVGEKHFLFDDSHQALEFVFSKYPRISELPSKTVDASVQP